MAQTPNLTRKTLVLAKRESTYGQDAFGGGPLYTGTNSCALLLWDEINPISVDTQIVDQQVVRASFSKYKDLVGRQLYNLRPKTMLMNTPGGSHVHSDSGDHTGGTGDNTGNSAIAGVPPFFGHLLRACGLSEATHSSSGVIYTPTSSSFNSATAYVWADSIRHLITGLYGSCVIEGRAGEGIDLMFDLKGNYADPTESTIPSSVTYPEDAKTLVETEGYANDQHTNGSGVGPLVRSFRFDLGTQVIERRSMNHSKGLYGLWITDRQPTLEIVCEVENNISGGGDDEFAPFADLSAAQEAAISFTHGSDPGSRCLFTFTAAQLRDVQYQDDQGIRTYSLQYNLTSVSDDGEYSIKFH